MSEGVDYTQHWDTAFTNSETQKLGWYESDVSPTMQLVNQLKLEKNARILNVGAGSTTLVDTLVSEGYSQIIANDISTVALNKLEERNPNQPVQFIVDDLTNAQKLHEIKPVDLWIDRAVLHFFNSDHDQDNYFELLKKLVSPNGHVIIAEFSLEGAEKCCALPVHRYSKEMIAEKLGDEFRLMDSFNYTFINPGGGERPYIYTLFKRK